jgi:hypothetical protein
MKHVVLLSKQEARSRRHAAEIEVVEPPVVAHVDMSATAPR